MTNSIEILKREIKALTPTNFVSKWMIDTVPYIFKKDLSAYIDWRISFSQNLNVDPNDILIAGSAGIGYSLNPYKDFKPFDSNSDIDIVVISQHYFNLGWFDLLNLTSSKWNMLNNVQQNSVSEHKARYIYYGCIATDKILSILSFAKIFQNTIDNTRRKEPTKNREISIRVYRNMQSFRAYHVNNLKKMQRDIP